MSVCRVGIREDVDFSSARNARVKGTQHSRDSSDGVRDRIATRSSCVPRQFISNVRTEHFEWRRNSKTGDTMWSERILANGSLLILKEFILGAEMQSSAMSIT